MTTDQGRAYCIARLLNCPDLDALRKVWGNLAIAYQNDPEIAALKDRIKARLTDE